MQCGVEDPRWIDATTCHDPGYREDNKDDITGTLKIV
jgi:hypothetical protein